MKEFCQLISDMFFLFLLTLMVDFSFSIKVFKNQTGGGPWMKKFWKKFILCLIYQKNCLENVDWKILIFVEVMD